MKTDYQISEKFKTKSELRSSRKKRADICFYKEHNKGNCMVEGSIRLYPWCDYCIKIRKLKKSYKKGVSMDSETLFKEAYKCFNNKNGDCPISYSDQNLFDRCFFCLEKIQGISPPENIKESNPLKKIKSKKKGAEIILKEPPGKELEDSDYINKKFKYPYLLALYPLLKDKNKFPTKYKGEETLLNQVSSMYGEYKIISYRDPKLMDFKVMLADIYLSDQLKGKRYEVSIKEFLKLLKLKSTGYYRSEILRSQHYLKNTTFITPLVDFKTGKKSGIHEWSILAEFKFHDEKKRKYFFEILLGDSFYKNIQKDYTLIEIKKVLSLSQIALNLYLYLTTQSPSKLYKYPKDFEILKMAIGITDTNLARAKKTFEKAWSDIKSKGLLKGYRYKIRTSKKDNKEKIRFSKQKELIS